MDKMKDLTFRDAVWLALIIFGAGASYMMLSSRLEAVEQKANTLEEIVLKENSYNTAYDVSFSLVFPNLLSRLV